jgi:hypothetical protein
VASADEQDHFGHLVWRDTVRVIFDTRERREQEVKRILSGLFGSLVIGGALLAVTSAPASAATTCSGSHLGNWSITGGYISVYYNSSTGYICAMTYTNKPGVSQHIMVSINVTGSSTVHEDSGTYQYYAGPVSVYAANKCIDFDGQVGNGSIEGVTHAYCS